MIMLHKKKSKKIHSFCFQAGYKIITYLPMDIEIVPPFFTSVQSRVIHDGSSSIPMDRYVDNW